MCTALGATVGALERGACLEGVLSMAISEVPLKWELGLGVTSLKNYNNSVPPTSHKAKSSRQGQQRTPPPQN